MMKKAAVCVLLTLILNLFSSCATKKEKAFKVFNEGVSLSLAAGEVNEKGHLEKALQLNKQAIEKFKETLKIDSNYKAALSPLAHSFYLDKQYNEAINWFDRANKADSTFAVSFLELGLCKINIGQLEPGREAIEHAVKLDSSKEMCKNTVDDLEDIGMLAFEFGKQYNAKGDTANGRNYQHFALSVLMMAFDFDNSRKDVSKTIIQFAEELKNKGIVDKYRGKVKP